MAVPADRVKGDLSFELIRPPDRHYSFRSKLLEADGKLIVLADVAKPSKPLLYRSEEVIAKGYLAVWFLFKNRPYDIARFYRPDGRWTGYYVDVLEPVRWHDADPTTLQPIVDLFLDLWIAPDGNYVILDEDEFEDAATKGFLTEVQIGQAHETLSNLVSLLERKEFPPANVVGFKL